MHLGLEKVPSVVGQDLAMPLRGVQCARRRCWPVRVVDDLGELIDRCCELRKRVRERGCQTPATGIRGQHLAACE